MPNEFDYGSKYTARNYLAALYKVSKRLSEQQKAALVAHALAKNSTLTELDLARAAGMGDENAFRVLYGRLGHAIADVLPKKGLPRTTGEVIWTRFLAIDSRHSVSGAFTWRMHAALVTALRKMGWLSKRQMIGQSNVQNRLGIGESFVLVTRSDQTPEEHSGSKNKFGWSGAKGMKPGDVAYVYVTGKGIAHRWEVASKPAKDPRWRYHCDMRFVSDINPVVAIDEIRTLVPREIWAAPHLNFRGYSCITIPAQALRLLRLLSRTSVNVGSAAGPTSLSEINKKFERELERARESTASARRRRLRRARKEPTRILVTAIALSRNADVVAEVMDRAGGRCEQCRKVAPFRRAKDGTPYLEVHHIITLAEGGDDTVKNAIALCPNCHRERHFGRSRSRVKATRPSYG